MRKGKKKDKNIHSKAYKYRLYPTKEQSIMINKTIGCARLIYNKILEDKIEHYKIHNEMLYPSLPEYKEKFEFLKEVDSQALGQSANDLNTAYTNFFEKRAGVFR